MSRGIPKHQYEQPVTHRRSVMSSRWDEPEDLGDGCKVRHIPSVNPDCIEHDQVTVKVDTTEGAVEVTVPAAAVTVPVAVSVAPPPEKPTTQTISHLPAPQEPAEGVAVRFDPTAGTHGKAVIRTSSQKERPPVVSGEVVKPLEASFATDMTAEDFLAFADQLVATPHDGNSRVKVWTDREGFVFRVALVDPA